MMQVEGTLMGDIMAFCVMHAHSNSPSFKAYETIYFSSSI